LRQEIVSELSLEDFPLCGYRDEEYLEAALAVGYDVADLAEAHDVSKKSIYRAVDEHGIDLQKPPSNGPARRLWEADPDAVGGGC
jgi:transposase